MDLNQFLSEHRILTESYSIFGEKTAMTRRAKMADGFEVSIQCSYSHRCAPKTTLENEDVDIYTAFELGFPSELDGLLAEYAEDEGTTETVFNFVPRLVVEKLIAKHGGIVGAV